jgi:ferredoxin
MHKTEQPEPSFHYIATRKEARVIIDAHDRYWVSNCGCREDGPGCKRSRIDVCLFFDTQMGGTGSNFHEVSREFVEGILKEAEEKHLVTRPFRYEDDKTRDQGICFCCDDCCGYFESDEWGCDPSKYIEQTDMEACTHCGVCEEVCYFNARKMVSDKLQVTREKCPGCGLCLDVCPEDCIEMVERV